MFKEVVFKMKTDLAGLPEMVDSVNVLTLADRRNTIEDIYRQMGISLGTAHKIVHDDLAFSNVSSCWVSLGQYK